MCLMQAFYVGNIGAIFDDSLTIFSIKYLLKSPKMSQSLQTFYNKWHYTMQSYTLTSKCEKIAPIYRGIG